MTDTELQADELLALTSIYDEPVIAISQDAEDVGGQFLSSVHLPDTTIKILSRREKSGNKDGKSIEEVHEVKFLPPVILNFQLPADYPSCSPPQFTLSCKWLNRKQLTALCHKLDEIWEENKGNEILFMWTSFLAEETMEFLGVESTIDLTNAFDSRKGSDTEPRAIQDIGSRDRLIPVVLDYDKQEKQCQFEKTMFQCKVCFSDRPGSSCIKFLDCDHVYCKDCMKDYFTVQIGEGNVTALSCPDEKCESQAHPSQVKALVNEELFDKYEKLLLRTGLDMMVDVMYCPRPACQYPVMLDRESNMGSCPSCSYSFCTLCKLVFHGKSPCRVKADGFKKLREEYQNADEENKRFLEKKYGKKTIEQALEEAFTNDWMESFAKQCPGCGAHIQKMDGCNKMTCMKCRSYFCWLCMSELSRNNPYKHFNQPGSKCHNRLFEGMDEDDDDFDIDDDMFF
ncbi:E3 ubiquitin-protein ligase RNF14-like [Mizuhopecten yessoensis]|uniref:RBR-type E3 ubiquitin transferase n=1 Tax=Mizuhopecten yessoensis TaxID=6573 RepID=A0A210QAL9_MIZYE|nr:E3 ubiquitin-protein ligase RNF14-like [Mizuhopecten yessoensis]OWF45776.1 E3 ubiquitin-protein ligase RNF14 [Mizuhopecten yessoensis]